MEGKQPWLVVHCTSKDGTKLTLLVFEPLLSIPAAQRKMPILVLCTDTRVKIPAIVEMMQGTLDPIRKCSQQFDLNIDANLLMPLVEDSAWANILGRGWPPPNRTLR